MSRPGSRRSYLAALGAGIAVIAASTYGVSLTRAAQDVSSAGAPTAVTASAVAVASAPVASTPAASTPVASTPAGSLPSSAAPASSSAAASAAPSSRASSGAPVTRAQSSATRSPSTSTSSAPASRAPASSSAPPAPSSAAPAAGQFKDGTYSATAQYDSPGGVEQVGVTVMLAGDVVTGSSLQLFGTGIAKSYQNLFQRSYAPQVTGKKIDTIKLAAVGGSSLTSGGFNAALEAIEAQARA